MAITISAPIGSSTGYTINALTLPGSLAAFWKTSPANLDLAVSLPTAATGRNLTALGKISGRSAWRLVNGVGQTDVASANLSSQGGSFSQNYYLPGGTDTFVASTFTTGSGVHFLNFAGQTITKAQNQGPSSDDIATVGSGGVYVLRGANGNDTLTGSTQADTLFGFDGNDSLTGGGGDDSLIGGMGNDTLTGNNRNDSLNGGLGDDSLDGGAGLDTAIFGAADNTVNLSINGAQNTGEGTDTLSNIENLVGGAGNDSLTGDNNANLLDGGTGNDTLNGGQGADTLIGGDGNDTLNGGQGSDSLIGGDGNDSLTGAGQNDTLIGGNGNDTLTGGVQADIFVFNNPNEGLDTITNFIPTGGSADSIRVSAAGFGGGLVAGTLPATRFLSGAGVTSANNANQRFIYNTTDGALRFDVDGNGAAAAIQIATLTGAPGLTAARIVVI